MDKKVFNMAIVGLGGVGGIIADAVFPYMRAPDANGWCLGRLRFIDRDAYATRNIPRQKAAGAMLGRNKATAWRDVFQASRWNNMNSEFDSAQEWVTNDTVERLLGRLCDNNPLVVMACVDNHPARMVLSRWVQDCVQSSSIRNVVVIQGGCRHNFATADLYGRWPVEDACIVVGTPFENNHPEVMEDTTGDRSKVSCGDLANSPEGDQTYAENFMAASMMMNLMFTLLTDRGPKTLSRHVGEVMEVTTHYHEITRKEPPGIPGQEGENATETDKNNDPAGCADAGAEAGDVLVHEETAGAVGEGVPGGVAETEGGDTAGDD